MSESHIEQLREWGYSVDRANAVSYLVRGPGLQLYVGVDDTETWEKLTDLDRHIERSHQQVEAPEDMQARREEDVPSE